MNKILISILLAELIVAPEMEMATAQAKVVAANYSDRYHEPSCRITQKIHPDDLLIFESPGDAQEQGFAPCKKCHPSAKEVNFSFN